MSDCEPLPDGSPRMQIVCRYCGSHAVLRDAWGSWDLEKQQWVLAEVLTTHTAVTATTRPASRKFLKARHSVQQAEN
jgi:ribosomal protein L37AE/L43A